MSKPNSISSAILRSPILWGGLVSFGFYAAIQNGPLGTVLVKRYFAGHPVEYIETILFFVALAALLIKLVDLAFEPRRTEALWLGPIQPKKQPITDCQVLAARLDALEPAARNSFIARRLRQALKSIDRHRSIEPLDEELRALADADAARAHADLGLVRVIISSIPILGFLGTVIGITEAVAQLAKVVGQVSFNDAINSVVAGLSVAFDTTALALILSMGLMFFLYFVNRLEARILADAEDQASRELVGRFESGAESNDPNVSAVRRMADEVIHATERLVERQSELWRDTVESAQKRWTSQAVTTERQLETALSKALRGSLEAHAQQIRETEQAVAQAGTQRWQQAVAALERSTSALAAQQAELREQGKVLAQAVDATGRVIQLEDALNRNLGALAGSHHFEQTVMSLSAAVNLLGARLGQPQTASPRVELRPVKTSGNAA